MRILHTSDWHLGKRLFKLDRFEEHALYLDWLIQTIIDKKIDLLLIAGDIFDTPSPPHQSMEMFYHFLYRLSVETSADTYIIAGNHDSGVLIEAPASLLRSHRVKVWGRLSQNPSEHWVRIEKKGKVIDLCALPFFRSHELLPQGQGSITEALKIYLRKSKDHPQILMLHHLAGLFEAAGSEQVISLSGIDSIPTEYLKDFDYVALGHIHKPQKISANAYYSGSPLPLRFSETKAKSVIIIDFSKDKPEIEIQDIPLQRPLISLALEQDKWHEEISTIQIESKLKPVAEVRIHLKGPQLGLVDLIRDSLETRGIELLSYIPFFEGEEIKKSRGPAIFDLSTQDLFKEFYASKFPNSPIVPDDIYTDFIELIEKARHASTQT